MSETTQSSEPINVEHIVASLREEVLQDVLRKGRAAEIPAIAAGVPLPDFSKRSALAWFVCTVPPFKQIVTLVLKTGRVLFHAYAENHREALRLLAEEVERQNFIINHLVEKIARQSGNAGSGQQ